MHSYLWQLAAYDTNHVVYMLYSSEPWAMMKKHVRTRSEPWVMMKKHVRTRSEPWAMMKKHVRTRSEP